MSNLPDFSSDPSFEVHLQALWDAYVTVGKEHGVITQKLVDIKNKTNKLEGYWRAPTFSDFKHVEAWFERVSAELAELLQEIVNRLRGSYDNYHNAELTNLGNLEGQHVEVRQVLLPYNPHQGK
jgi:uncharacterized protein YukE